MQHPRRAALLVIPMLLAVVSATTTSVAAAKKTELAPPSGQVLKYPVPADVTTLDPALVISGEDIAVVQEIFGGLYRFNNSDTEIPYMATAMPTVSSNGLTYTFHLRQNLKFSNGVRVTSADVLYSWNRAARIDGQYGYVFSPVVGYTAVVPASGSPTATTLSGLTAPGPYTIQAQLTQPASYWLSELGLPVADVVDQSVIPNDLNRTWWTTPSTAIGTGPFRLSAYVPKDHLIFTPVPNWWGGSTGHLTSVEIEVLADSSSQVSAYLDGGLDEIGPSSNFPPLDAVEHFLRTPSLKDQVQNDVGANTVFVGFNLGTGPFSSKDGGASAAKAGRLAFTLSINRQELVDVVCGSGGITCADATGGIISKGLLGYLGNGKDPTATFNPSKARQELKAWDPKGTKRQNLTYWYYTGSATEEVADNLQSQWEKNLGIHVNIEGLPFPTYIAQLESKTKYDLFADAWGADYNNPYDWMASQFICSERAAGLGNVTMVCDSSVDAAVAKAEVESGAAAISEYKRSEAQLLTDVPFIVLYYGRDQYFIKPYVKGAGGNALYDFSWTGIEILKH